MMMWKLKEQRSVLLSVPAPCRQKWSEMVSSGTGKFCASCQKTVVDFAQMSDEAIISFLAQHPDQKICGRLLPEQLQRPIVAAAIKRREPGMFRYLLGLAVLFATKHAQADIVQPVVRTENISRQDGKEALCLNRVDTTVRNRYVQGKIVDRSTQQPIPFASIVWRDGKNGVKSDSAGMFRFRMPKSYDTAKAQLTISAAGYEPVNIAGRLPEYSYLPYHLIMMDASHILGGVTLVQKEKKWWQFWKKR